MDKKVQRLLDDYEREENQPKKRKQDPPADGEGEDLAEDEDVDDEDDEEEDEDLPDTTICVNLGYEGEDETLLKELQVSERASSIYFDLSEQVYAEDSSANKETFFEEVKQQWAKVAQVLGDKARTTEDKCTEAYDILSAALLAVHECVVEVDDMQVHKDKLGELWNAWLSLCDVLKKEKDVVYTCNKPPLTEVALVLTHTAEVLKSEHGMSVPEPLLSAMSACTALFKKPKQHIKFDEEDDDEQRA